ncbi:hypothetical protein PC123_g18347 [Phytophthora cactorum]|nr:hypothetical protein PC123_g18347 [Phytophthora cactorum]
MQHDHEGRDRVVYYQSRQLKPAECHYPVHDKELLAMKYALAKFRVYLLGSEPFVVYTDHASLRTAVKSPHISQRMAGWLACFAEYDFRVEYKPGRLNVVADALSRRPDYAVKTADANRIGIVVPNDYDLRMRIMYEYHDAPTAGHPGREKTYVLLTRDFYWNHEYKWVRKLRFNHFRHRRSISMDFVFGLPPDSKRRTGVVVFVDRFSKMVHLAAVPAEVRAVQTARLVVDMVFKHHGIPLDIVSDRDPRFTARFWQEAFTFLGTQLSMSTADLPQTDGQTECVNRVLGDLLKSYAHSFQQ